MIKKYLEKYKKLPTPVRASFWFLVCSIIQNGLSIITLPIFTRVLTTDQYGLSSTYFAWYDLIVVFCTLRLSYGVFDKGMIKYSEGRDQFESALLGLTTTISICMLGVFFIFHKTIESLLGMSFILCFSLFLCQIFAPAMLFWTARNKFEYRYRKFAIATIVCAVVCTMFNLAAVLIIKYDRGVVKILSYQAIWSIVYLFFYIYIFASGKTFYKKDVWKYALKFNLPLIPYFLSTLILDKADRIMIGSFCGNSSVALYSVSFNLGRLMILLTSALDATFTPWIYSKIKEKELSKCKTVSLMIMIGMFAVAVAFMLFAPELIGIFADSRYKEAVYIIPPVIASYYFVMLYQLVSKVEFYFERTKTIAIVTMIAAGLNVILNYLTIPKYGYIAAGYTTLFSYVTMAILHMIISYFLTKKEGINVEIFPWLKFIILGGAMILVTVVVNALYSSAVIRFGIATLIAILLFIFRKKLLSILYILRNKE